MPSEWYVLVYVLGWDSFCINACRVAWSRSACGPADGDDAEGLQQAL